MREVQVSLDFDCCGCSKGVGVTVICEGPGLAAGPGAVADVVIPCPHCKELNHLFFTPSGTVCEVASYVAPLRIPAGSVN